jgi:hypothetical protein
MARSDTLPIFLATYKLTVILYRVTQKFTREHKYSLGQDIRHDAMQLLRCITQANHQKNKAPYLDSFLAVLEQVRMEIRLCTDLNAMPMKNVVEITLVMDGIAKQAAAWKKAEVKKCEQNDEQICGNSPNVPKTLAERADAFKKGFSTALIGEAEINPIPELQ